MTEMEFRHHQDEGTGYGVPEQRDSVAYDPDAARPGPGPAHRDPYQDPDSAQDGTVEPGARYEAQDGAAEAATRYEAQDGVAAPGTRYEDVPAAEPEPDDVRMESTPVGEPFGAEPEPARAGYADVTAPVPGAVPEAGDQESSRWTPDWDADEIQRRWHGIQASFVDDPRDAVEKADNLVEEAVSSLTTHRQELMEHWKNTGQGDTEKLRLALRDYRSLLERLTGPFLRASDREVS
jgi:hypothetical protein